MIPEFYLGVLCTLAAEGGLVFLYILIMAAITSIIKFHKGANK